MLYEDLFIKLVILPANFPAERVRVGLVVSAFLGSVLEPQGIGWSSFVVFRVIAIDFCDVDMIDFWRVKSITNYGAYYETCKVGYGDCYSNFAIVANPIFATMANIGFGISTMRKNNSLLTILFC